MIKKQVGLLLTLIYSVPRAVAIQPNEIQAYIYSLLKNDDLTNQAHSKAVAPPFRIKQINRDQQTLKLTISFLTDTVATEFISQVKKLGFLKVGFQKYPFREWIGQGALLLPTDWRTLEAKQFLTLNFDSPTFFKCNDHNNPLPIPALVFESIARSVKEYTKITLPVDTVQDIKRHVSISYLDIHSSFMTAYNTEFIGFSGTVTFKLSNNAPIYLCKLLNMLALWAIFTGVGAKTCFGFGTVNLSKIGESKNVRVQ